MNNSVQKSMQNVTIEMKQTVIYFEITAHQAIYGNDLAG
jgi:hypothetical protein